MLYGVQKISDVLMSGMTGTLTDSVGGEERILVHVMMCQSPSRFDMVLFSAYLVPALLRLSLKSKGPFCD